MQITGMLLISTKTKYMYHSNDKIIFFFKFTIVMNTHLLRMNMDVVNTKYPTLHNEHTSNSKMNVKLCLACM